MFFNYPVPNKNVYKNVITLNITRNISINLITPCVLYMLRKLHNTVVIFDRYEISQYIFTTTNTDKCMTR